MRTLALRLRRLRARGFFHVLLGNILSKAVAFISSITVVRFLDKTEYAHLTYVNNLYSYISLLSGLGLSVALLKFCSSAASAELNRAYLTFALKLGASFQLFASAVLTAYVFTASIPFPAARRLVVVMALTPTLSYILESLLCTIRAYEQNRLYAGIAITQTLSVALLSILGVLLIGVYGVAVASYLALVIPFALALRFIAPALSTTRKAELDRKQIRSFMTMSVSLMTANLFSMLMPLNEMFLVNVLLKDTTATANYRVAALIPSQLVLIPGSIMIYYFPVFARMTENAEILRTVRNIGVVTASIVGLVGIVGCILSPVIINFAFGPAYRDASRLSIVLWLTYALNAGYRMVPMNVLPALGRTHYNVLLAAVSTVGHVVLAYCFISTKGIMGSAVALGVVYAVTGAMYWRYLLRACRSDRPANITADCLETRT